MPSAKQLATNLATLATTSSRPAISRKTKSAPKIKDDSSSYASSSEEEQVKPEVVKVKRKAEVGEGEGSKRVKKEEPSEEEEVQGVGAVIAPPPATTLGERSKNVGSKFSPGQGQDDYELTMPEPWRDAKGEYRFDDQPNFRPNLSPEEILRAGAFGGTYFRNLKSAATGITYTTDWQDMPKEWYAGLSLAHSMTRKTYEPKVNKWKVKVGTTYEAWCDSGWIMHKNAPRGQFHWYCRYFAGRRSDDDARQIDRQIKIASPASGRWRRNYLGKYVSKNVKVIDKNKEEISKGIRQTLLHWAYEPNTADLAAFRKEKGL